MAGTVIWPDGGRREDRYRLALQEIVNTLGPDNVCDCDVPEGCGLRAEASEALRVARAAIEGEPDAVPGGSGG